MIQNILTVIVSDLIIQFWESLLKTKLNNFLTYVVKNLIYGMDMMIFQCRNNIHNKSFCTNILLNTNSTNLNDESSLIFLKKWESTPKNIFLGHLSVWQKPAIGNSYSGIMNDLFNIITKLSAILFSHVCLFLVSSLSMYLSCCTVLSAFYAFLRSLPLSFPVNGVHDHNRHDTGRLLLVQSINQSISQSLDF